jgi:hypothetical protein
MYLKRVNNYFHYQELSDLQYLNMFIFYRIHTPYLARIGSAQYLQTKLLQRKVTSIYINDSDCS